MATDDVKFKCKNGYILFEDLISWYIYGFLEPDDRVVVYREPTNKMVFTMNDLISRFCDNPERVKKLRVSEENSRKEKLRRETLTRDVVTGDIPEIEIREDADPSLAPIVQVPPKILRGPSRGRIAMPGGLIPPTKALKEWMSEMKKHEDEDQWSRNAGPRTRIERQAQRQNGTNQVQNRMTEGIHNSNSENQEPGTDQAHWPRNSGPQTRIKNQSESLEEQVESPQTRINRAHSSQVQDQCLRAQLLQPMNQETSDQKPPGLEIPFSSRLRQIESGRFSNFHLFHRELENGNGRMIGREVVEEMEKLMILFPMKLWSPSDEEYFDKVLGDIHCSTCEFTSSEPYQIISHLFSKQHVQKLSWLFVSQDSFRFWRSHFEECNRQKNRDIEPFVKVPLLYSKSGENKQKLDPDEIAQLIDLMSKVPENRFLEDRFYLGKFYASIYAPDTCKICIDEKTERPMAIGSNFYQNSLHIFSENHLKNLENISQEEVNFWINILTLEANSDDEKSEEMVGILNGKNTLPMALVDYQIKSKMIDKNLRGKKLNDLAGFSGLINPTYWTEESQTRQNLNYQCFGCSTPNQPIILKSLTDLKHHLFTSDHLKYLIEFGFSEADLQAWFTIINGILQNQSSKPLVSYMNILTINN